VNGEYRAYPRQIMEVREMVNDTLGGRDLGIPYCTLCGAAQAYFTDRMPDGVERPVLRTSGLLIRSNKVMYDVVTSSVFDTFLGKAVTGVVLDRITGLIGLALLIAIGLPLLMQRTTENSAVLGFALVLAAFGAGLLAVFGIARLSETGFGGAGRVFIIRLSRLLARLLRHPGEAMTIFPLAVATHILMVLIAYVSADALRLDFSFLDCLIVVPASILIATLPISLGGWGVREGAMAAGFGLIGADAGGAVALSIVMGLQLVLVGLAGGAVWFFGDAARPDTDSLTLAKEGD